MAREMDPWDLVVFVPNVSTPSLGTRVPTCSLPLAFFIF